MRSANTVAIGRMVDVCVRYLLLRTELVIAGKTHDLKDEFFQKSHQVISNARMTHLNQIISNHEKKQAHYCKQARFAIWKHLQYATRNKNKKNQQSKACLFCPFCERFRPLGLSNGFRNFEWPLDSSWANKENTSWGLFWFSLSFLFKESKIWNDNYELWFNYDWSNDRMNDRRFWLLKLVVRAIARAIAVIWLRNLIWN